MKGNDMTAFPSGDIPAPPPPPSQLRPPVTPQEARAQAKAAKAHAKAMRPWYRKKRWWILGLVAVIIVASVAGSSGGDKAPTVTVAGVDKGIGSRDASADVQVVSLGAKDILGHRTAELSITNNSSKRSNYIIELTLESPDGKTQYDSTIATASNVEPGQTTGGTVLPFTKTGPAAGTDAAPVVKVKSVSRTAA